MPATFQRVTFNFGGSPVRKTMLNGREYWVAPCASLTEGVLNGSNGPLFYPAEEISKRPHAWNHMPIVLDHPEVNGQGVSARDPIVLETRGLGILLNTVWDNKLRHECWFDVERTRKLSPETITALEQNKMMEVSTGLYTDNEEAPEGSNYNGTPYEAIARNHQPDHLAILPDKIGAYPISAGGGLLQLNKNGEISHSDLSMALTTKLRETLDRREAEFSYVQDVFDSHFVYRVDGKLFKQKYKLDGSEVSFSGSPTEVRQVTSYNPVGNKESIMDKKKLVDSLVANKATKWEEKDREFLMSLNEEQLQKMEPVANQPPPKPKKEETAEEDDEDETEPIVESDEHEESEETEESVEEVIKNQAKPKKTKILKPPSRRKPQSVEEYVANAPQQIREVLNAGMNQLNRERDQLISAITENSANLFDAEYLKTKSLDELRGIAALAQASQSLPHEPVPSYVGAAGVAPIVNVGSASEDPLVTPDWSAVYKPPTKERGVHA